MAACRYSVIVTLSKAKLVVGGGIRMRKAVGSSSLGQFVKVEGAIRNAYTR
jgi:hypothetical protein